MGKYFITTTEDSNEHGFKARVDIINILEKIDFKEIKFDTYLEQSMKNMTKDLKLNFNRLKNFLINMENNSVLIVQYPWNSMMLKYSKLIKKYCNKTNSKSIAIIHDINSLRTKNKFGKFYFKFVVNEYKYLNNFNYIICHNYKMKELLIENGIDKEKIIELGIFDYLVDSKNDIIIKDYKVINIAGNLNHDKAEYVYKLNDLSIKNYKVNLYGINYDGESNDIVRYNGSFKPDELTKKLNRGFGLVWDGESLNECSGSYGEYLKINNPHKYSSYMACGIPVIIWKEAALAKFTEENHVGIVVESLNELDNIFEKMTENEYYELIKNVQKIQDKVINGEFLIDALKNI